MERECPQCGLHIDMLESKNCLKCDYPLIEHIKQELYKVDVCHSREDWPAAKVKILDGLDMALRGGFAGLRVIHGYGSGRGHTSFIRSRSISFIKELAKKRGYEMNSHPKNKGETLLLLL